MPIPPKIAEACSVKKGRMPDSDPKRAYAPDFCRAQVIDFTAVGKRCEIVGIRYIASGRAGNREAMSDTSPEGTKIEDHHP
jgi:hypothetical protein